MNLFTFLIILLGIQICYVEFARKKIFLYDFFSVLNFTYLLVYVITPLYFFLTDKLFVYDALKSLFYSLLGYQFIWIGWVLGQRKRSTNTINEYNSDKDEKWLNISIYAFWITVASFTVLTISRGGIYKAIAQGALTRYSIEEIDDSSFAYLSRIVSMLPFLSLIFFNFFLKRNEYTYKNKILFYFYFSLIVSVLNTFITASRGGMLRIFLMFLLLSVLLQTKVNIKKLVLFGVFFVLFTAYGKQTFYAVSNYFYSGESISKSFSYMNNVRQTDEKNKGDLVFNEFAHPTQSINAAVEYNEIKGNYTYFRDFSSSLLRVVPRKMTPFLTSPKPINAINTHQLKNNFGAGIPPGLIASFYYSLGTIGVILGSFLYGYIGRSFNDFLIGKINFNSIYLTFYVYFAFFYGFFTTNGDPNVYIYYIIFPFLLMFIGNRVIKYH